MPEIEGKTDFKQKVLQFQNMFFTKLPISTSKDLTDYAYKDVYGTPKKISTHEICEVINKLSRG